MKLKLRTKLLAGFIVVAIIGTVIGIIGVINMKSIEVADTKLYEKMTVPISILLDINQNFQRIRVNIRDLLRETNKTNQKDNEDKIIQFFEDNNKLAIEYEKLIISDEMKKEFEIFNTAKAEFRKQIDAIIKLDNEDKIAEAYLLLDGAGFTAAQAEMDAIQKMTDYKIADAKKTSEENTKLANISSTIMIAAIIIGFIISIILALWLGISVISNPLMKISDTLKNSSGQIALASNQLSSSSQEIANGATEQASSIEETTSSMEELASMVKQNVGNAKEASTLADKAAQASEVGHNQMESMLGSMNDINKSSEQIKKVIKVIDDIAFQTNILALNAAVEAARAGEAGMGFAVVADEVKNLANKSAEAAKETANMIEDSIKKTELGLQTATKLADVFKEILSNAKKVAEMSKEVETASIQQDSGINQVNKAIVQFDEVVQANASSAEETASSAEELLAQVESLNDVVSKLVALVTGKIEELTSNIRTKRIEVNEQKISKNTIPVKKTKQLVHNTTNIPKKKREVSPDQIIPFEEDEEFKDTDKE